MTKIKVGPKGQITLTKELRDKFGINPGSLVEELETKEGILIKSVDNSLDRWSTLKKKVSKKWPSEVTSVQAIQEDRTK
ncbi:MAG TPA: AbrB/MazE/SpoVT family DNA-binding domain-containing protein [Candidatus Lokiarchaeia archaeon]